MGILLSHSLKDVTVWKKGGRTLEGNTAFTPPVVVKARYQDIEILRTEDGISEVVKQTAVYTEEIALDEGDWAYLGVSTQANPSSVIGAKEIKYVRKEEWVTKKAVVYKGMLA